MTSPTQFLDFDTAHPLATLHDNRPDHVESVEVTVDMLRALPGLVEALERIQFEATGHAGQTDRAIINNVHRLATDAIHEHYGVDSSGSPLPRAERGEG